MNKARQLGDRSGSIVAVARQRIGATVVKPDQLAAVIPLWLAPHEGEPLDEDTLAAMAADEGCLGAVQYDARLPQAIQDRVVARACAAWLVEDAGEDPSDRALVDDVASALCGAAKPVVKAAAVALDATVERVKARR